MTMTKTNEVIGKALGFTPEVVWAAVGDDGNGMYVCSTSQRHDTSFHTKGDIERWIKEHPKVCGEVTRLKSFEYWPTFDTDLQACAEAEARLTGEQRVKYGYALAEELRLDLDMNGADAFVLATATPAQRSQALLAVLKGGK